MTTDPKIYVASLSDYNNGTLHGAWIELDGKDASEVSEEITAMLETSPSAKAYGTKAEEYAIHDHEGFGSVAVGEYDPIDKLVEKAEFIVEHGEDVAAVAVHVHAIGMHPVTRAPHDCVERDRSTTVHAFRATHASTISFANSMSALMVGAIEYLPSGRANSWPSQPGLTPTRTVSPRPQVSPSIVMNFAAGLDMRMTQESLLDDVVDLDFVKPSGSKVARAYAASSRQLVGGLFISDRVPAAHIQTLVKESEAFPGAAHDDIVDALAMAVNTVLFNPPRKTAGSLTTSAATRI